MDNRPIGMFDSGVGGITVFKEVRNKLPNEDIIYLGDTKRFPYGSKSKDTIINLTKNGIDFLLSQNVKAIIIACGTATSQALEEVQKIYKIPIIGIIKPTVDYIASSSHLRKIGVVATSGTIRSNGWQNNLLSVRSDLEIINKSCPLLAPMAEEGWTNNDIAKLTVHEYMKDLHDVDALILGCTHYPLFKDLFKLELKSSAEIINTGNMIADYLEKNFNSIDSNLFDRNLAKVDNSQIYLTDTECNFINVASRLLGKPITNIKQCNI